MPGLDEIKYIQQIILDTIQNLKANSDNKFDQLLVKDYTPDKFEALSNLLDLFQNNQESELIKPRLLIFSDGTRIDIEELEKISELGRDLESLVNLTSIIDLKYSKQLEDKEIDNITLYITQGIEPWNLASNMLLTGEKREQVMTKINEFVNAVDKFDLSDMQKAIITYNYLLQNSQYDTDNKQRKDNYNLYGVICEGLGVCEGYGYAMTSLNNSLKVPTIFVTTYVNQNTNHMWNLIKDNGKWYHCDASTDSTIYNKDYMINKELVRVMYENFGLSQHTSEKLTFYEYLDYDDNLVTIEDISSQNIPQEDIVKDVDYIIATIPEEELASIGVKMEKVIEWGGHLVVSTQELEKIKREQAELLKLERENNAIDEKISLECNQENWEMCV